MTAFKAMTWNVENLFRPASGVTQADQQRFQRKLALLADVINRLDPDVVTLQEIGGEEPLHDLQQALDGGYPHRAVSAFPDSRGIRVAFLSKHTVDEQEDIVDFPPGPALDIRDLTATGGSTPINRMGRGALRIRVTKNGLTVDLITAHLKSKLLSFPRPGGGTDFSTRDEGKRAQVAGIALMRRMAEAVTLRIRVNALLEGNNRTPLLVLGDVNDVPEAQTSLILNGPPEARSARGGSISRIGEMTLASSTLPRGSLRIGDSLEWSTDAGNCSTRSSRPRSSSRSDKITVGDSRKRWTVTSTSKAIYPPWETTPAHGRRQLRPITRQ